MYSIENIQERINSLHLDYFYEKSKTDMISSNRRRFHLQYSKLIEALDLHDNYNSSPNLFYGNKNTAKNSKIDLQHDGYISKMKYTLYIVWNLFTDVYWFLLGTKLIRLNSDLKNKNEIFSKKDMMIVIQANHRQRVFNNLLDHLTCYQCVVLLKDIHLKYIPCNLITSYNVNYVYHNLNFMRYDENNYISKFIITNTEAFSKHSEYLCSMFVKLDKIFMSLRSMQDNCMIGLNMDPTAFYAPVEMYTTVLNITIGIEHATDVRKLSSNKCQETYYSTSPCHLISYYRSELIITIENKSHFLKFTGKELVNSAVSQNQNKLIHSEPSQQVNNGCSYRTSAYFSWFRHHVIPLSLANETIVSVNDDNDLNTRKWDMFIIWQGQLNTSHNDDQMNLEQLDISFDHTNKSVSMASFHMNPNITTNTSQIDEGGTSAVANEDNEDADNTESDITQMNDKFSPLSTNSHLHVDDNKYYEDSAYQTLYADDNIDHIKWDTQSIIDSHETFGILSEVSSMQIKQIPIDHDAQSLLDSDNMDSSVVCMKTNLPRTDECEDVINNNIINDNDINNNKNNEELSILSEEPELHHNVDCCNSSQSDYNVLDSITSSLYNINDTNNNINHINNNSNNIDEMDSRDNHMVEHNNHHELMNNKKSSFIQFNFINSSLTQLENKLSHISLELEEMERNEHLSDEYIKEIDNIFQLLHLIKKDTSQIDYIISRWNMDKCLSESDDYVTASIITNLYNEYTDLSQLTGKVEPMLEISQEENYQGHIPTRLSTLKCLRVDLMKRCDRLVARLEKQTSNSAVNINDELDFISQNLVSLAHKLDDPDNNDSSNDTDPSTIADKLEKRITDLQEIQKEFTYIEENLQRLKYTSVTDSLSCKSITKLDCIESELNDMQINLRNKIIYLNGFHEQYSNLTTALQEEFKWMEQQENDLNLNNIQSESNGPQANNNYDNNTGYLEQDITVLYNLIVKLSQYYHHKLLPMLENYDKLMSDGVRPQGIITSIYNTEDNVYLSVNILNLWNRITKELMPRKFNELITRSYEQITRNLTSTFQYIPTLQSFEFLFPNGNLPNSNSLHCHVNIISDHINIIQGEIDWLHKYIEPITMNEDRLNLFTDTITNTTVNINITTNDNNVGISDQIVKFYEVNQHLTQLLSYFTQIYQQLSVFYIPTMDKYHQTIDHALTYINTIQHQVELLRNLALSMKISDKDDKEDCESTNYDDEQNENVECALITYEKLETLCTGKEQCLELLEHVGNNHRTIIDELVNMVKQIQISVKEVMKSTDNSQQTMTSATTMPVNTITTSTYLSKLLDPIESTSQRFLYFISEIQKIISEYDQLIIHTSTRQKLVPQELSVSENTLDTFDIHDSELFQDACISSVKNYQHHLNVFDKQYEELLNESLINSWSVVRDHSHLNDENQLNGQTLLDNNLSPTIIHSCDSNERRNTEVIMLNNILKKIDCLESNLKLSCCNIMNDDLVKNRVSQVNELRSDVTDKLNQTIKEIELVRMSSQQIEYAQAKLNALKSTFKQSSDLFQHSIITQNEAELVTNIFETCGQLIKKRLSETNQVIDKLQELTDETNSTNPGRYLLQNFNFDDENDIFPSEITHTENDQLVDSINSDQNDISLTYFNIPLWYEQTKVNDEVINFLEHIKNQRQQLLFSYELSQRLAIWLSVTHPRMTKLKVKFQHLSVKSANLSGNNDLCSHLHDVTLYRLELFSQLPMFQCILNDFNEFKDVIFHLSEDYTSDNKIDRIEQAFFACFNKYEHDTSLNGSIIHYTEQKILTIMNDFNNIITESSVYLSAIRNRLIETNQISTVLNELSNLLDEFSCLDERFVKDCMIDEEELPVHCTENNLSVVKNVYLNNWTKVKILEMWHNELKSMQTLLKTISNDRCFDTIIANTTTTSTTTTTTDKIKIENDVKQLKLKMEQQSYHLTKKKIELTNQINQENKLQSSITAYSVWLSQLNDKLIKLAKPNNLTLDTVKSTWKEFKDWNLKSLNESKLRINHLIKQLPNSIFNDIFKQDKSLFTNIEDYNNIKLFNELLYNQNSLLLSSSFRNNKIKSHLELNLLYILRQYRKFQLQSIESMKLWKIHLKFIKYFIVNKKQLQLLLNEIYGSLSKLYRPSKLVGCCTEQLNSVKNAIHQLKTHERLAINLYNSIPLIKSLCHPIEVSQTVATINTMKHNFTSLMRRAIERRKILTQALKEDTRFDVAYYTLLNWFLTKLEILESFEIRTVHNENSQLSLKTLHREFHQQQSDYHLVMRMGSNLRERCTCTDPEKNILNEMLEKLQLVKGNYGKRLSKCQIQISEMLITKQNPKSALSRLNEWLQMIEEHLGIENTLNIKHTTNTGTTTFSSSIKPSQNDQTETNNSDHHLSTNVTELSEYLSNSTQYTMTIFNPKEYENIASVLGDIIFVQSLNSNHLVLAEDLREHENLYQILVKNDHNNNDEFNKLKHRFVRLKQAFNLREKYLQIAADVALELNKNYSNLISWLLEVTNKLNNNEIELAYVTKKKETVLQKQTLFLHSADQYKIRLNMYAKIHHQQIHTYRPIFNQFEKVLKRVLAKPQVDKHEEQNISVYCYSKCRRQFIIQYKQIVNLWHKLDQSLQCLRLQLLSQQSEQALIHDLIEFECEEQWVDEQTLQLNQSLTIDETIFQNLSKRIIPIDLIGSTVEQDSQILANMSCSNGSSSLVLDSECDHVISNTSSCELKECVSNSVNHGDHENDDNVVDDHDYDVDGSVDERACKDLEVRISFAKENFEAIKNKEQKICDCINAYRNLCEIITDNGNSSINNLPSIDASGQYPLKKELVNENYNIDYSYSPVTTDADQDNCDRANKLKTSYYNLLNRSSQRIKQLERYHKKLLEHNLLVHFDFDLWKQGYLQWIANRHYRLSDIFNPKALSALRTDRQLSNISTNTDEANSDLFKCPTRLSNVSTNSIYTSSNNIKPQLSNSRSSLIRSSSESLQPFSDNKHKQNVSHKSDEVNCSQFIQAVLHGRPTHDWANPIFIKSAFYTIDQAKKGIVTCHQIIEALSSKKQHKPLPTDKLIEHAIEQETSKCVCQPKFQPRKIGKDRYCFGSSSRVYLVRFLNSTTIVRVGGGWMSLNEFLDSRDPCRITHKTCHFGSTPIKANLINTSSTSKRESNLGLINVTPINKSRLTTLTNMNSKEQRSFVSTPLTSKDCDMKSLNSSYENEASIHNNSSLLKQTVPTKTTIFNRATSTRTSTNKKINK
ncbi:unnamed protein product [Schistosoma spindalis]|nr:unnamed protein product [Schistosoma spindale]